MIKDVHDQSQKNGLSVMSSTFVRDEASRLYTKLIDKSIPPLNIAPCKFQSFLPEHFV